MTEFRSRRTRSRNAESDSVDSGSNASSNETTPLLSRQDLSKEYPQWSTRSVIAALILIYSISIGIWAILLSSWGFAQEVLENTNPLVLKGSRTSGRRAWSVVESIAQHPHPYNSGLNDKVAEYLNSQLLSLQKSTSSWPNTRNCSNVAFEIAPPDSVNVSVPYEEHTIYYESSNILTRIKGKSDEAILVSSHYDSVAMAPGATDDSIAVGSMMAVMEAVLNHICHDNIKFEYSIIFLWNNAEEIALLGADAFVLHPWFKDVKAFINLEGSGAAVKERPTLFRTNSFDLVSSFLQGAPFPHMSVTTNQVMRVIPSDTDYRPYAGIGGLPGIDVAFTTFRHHYHTATDDLNHASPIAAQHMADNVLGVVSRLATDKNALASFNKSLPIGDPLRGVLPVPDFYFHDVMGWTAILVSKWTWILAHVVLFAVSAFFVIGCAIFSKVKSAPTSLIKVLKGMMMMWGLVVASILFCLTVAYVKHSLSPASTYGLAELNFCWYIGANLFCISGFASFFSPSSTKTLREHETSLTYGLWAFWTALGFLSFVLSQIDMNLIYFLLYPVAFSTMAFMVYHATQIVFVADKKGSALSTYNSWKPLIVPLLSIPPTLFLNMDFYRQFFTCLPSLISDGLPSYALDTLLSFLVIFPFLNVLPLLIAAKSKPALFRVMGFLFILPYIASIVIFPLGPERPLKVRYVETMRLDTETGFVSTSKASIQVANGIPALTFMDSLKLPQEWNYKCEKQICAVHDLPRPTHLDKYEMKESLIEANLTGTYEVVSHPTDSADGVHNKKALYEIVVDAWGSPGSRACFVEVQFSNKNFSSNIHLDTKPQSSEHSNWKSLLPHHENRHTSRIDVLRRDFGPSPNHSIHIPLYVDISYVFQDSQQEPAFVSNATLTISCAHHDDLSTNAKDFYDRLPPYSVKANLVNKKVGSRLVSNRDRHGHFITERTFVVSFSHKS